MQRDHAMDKYCTSTEATTSAASLFTVAAFSHYDCSIIECVEEKREKKAFQMSNFS